MDIHPGKHPGRDADHCFSPGQRTYSRHPRVNILWQVFQRTSAKVEWSSALYLQSNFRKNPGLVDYRLRKLLAFVTLMNS